MIRYTVDRTAPEWQGYFYAVLLFVTAIIQSLCLHQYFYRCTVVGMRVRSAVIHTVYSKVCVSVCVCVRTSDMSDNGGGEGTEIRKENEGKGGRKGGREGKEERSKR